MKSQNLSDPRGMMHTEVLKGCSHPRIERSLLGDLSKYVGLSSGPYPTQIGLNEGEIEAQVGIGEMVFQKTGVVSLVEGGG